MRLYFVPPSLVLGMLLLSSALPKERHEETASVHIRVVNEFGQDLGEAQVKLFKSNQENLDLASHFQRNTAAGIPFGIYKMRVFAPGFWSAEREVRVFQSDVWVVVALELGMGKFEGGFPTTSLTGKFKDLPPTEQSTWVRLSGIYSGVIMDTRANTSGGFAFAGVPNGLYILVATRGERVVHVETVHMPAPGPLEIGAHK